VPVNVTVCATASLALSLARSMLWIENGVPASDVSVGAAPTRPPYSVVVPA
jgi:hypothetical protein